MDKVYVLRRLRNMKQEGLREAGRRWTTWKDEVGKDTKMLGIWSWSATAMNRGEYRKLLTEANTFYELQSKAKLSRYRPEQAHGRSGRLRRRIFLTLGTRRW
jgi:hypothetical protein